MVGGRSASRACSPSMRSSRIPPAPRRLARRLADLGDPHRERLDVLELDREPVPARLDREPPALDLDRLYRRAAVVVREQIERGDIARRVERHRQHVPLRQKRAIRLPVRGRVAVQRRERPVLRELREPGRGRRGHRRDPVVDRDGLRIRAERGERVEHGRVHRRLLARGQHRPGVLREPRRHEHAPPVGVGDHDLVRRRDLRRADVARVRETAFAERRDTSPARAAAVPPGLGGVPAGRRPTRRALAVRALKRGQRGEPFGGAVDDHGRAFGLDPDQAGRGRAIPGAHRGQRAGVTERAGGAQALARRAEGGVRLAQLVEDVRGFRGGGGAAALAVVVGAGDDHPRAEQVEQRVQLARDGAALLDERVDGPQQVGRAQVGIADRVAGRDRRVGERRQDRVDRAAPVVVRVQLAGQHHRAPVPGARIHVVRRRLPGGRDPLPQQLVVHGSAAGQWPAGDDRQRHEHHGPPPGRGEPGQHGHAQGHQRRRLVRSAQKLHRYEVVVRKVRRTTKRCSLREAGRHHDQADQHQRQGERREPPAPGRRESTERQRGHEQPGEHHGQREQQHAAVPEVRAQVSPVPDPEVGDPVAHQPQRLGQRRRRPDRPGLLREAQEVHAVARLDEQRHHPPRRRQRRRQPGPPGEAPHPPQVHRARPPQVGPEQRRTEQDPRRHGGVHAAAGRGHDQRERRRPAPPARRQPPSHRDQQPRQRGVPQKRDRRPRAEDDDVRVQQEQQPATACEIPRAGPASSSINRTAPHAARNRINASHSRCTSHGAPPSRWPSAKNGPIGNR